MSYFVTGATGFIGRHLVERLLDRPGQIYVLVRESSTDKLGELMSSSWASKHPDAVQRIRPVIGDLGQPRLGVDESTIAELTGADRPLLPPRGDL
jgi:thioester reductase-like protein